MEAATPYLMYLLIDPIDNKIRYVGKTKQKPMDRLNRHIWDAQERRPDGSWSDRTHRANWIRKVLAQGQRPRMAEMCRYLTLFEVNEAEKLFIKHIRAVRSDLTNATDGGDGGIVPRKPACTDEEVIAAYRSGLSSKKIAKKYKTCSKRVLRVLRAAGFAMHRGRSASWEI